MKKSDPELFLSEVNPASRRAVVLDEDSDSCWLYLTEPGGQQPVADVWVFNRIPAPVAHEIEAYRNRPPPAMKDVVDGFACYRRPRDFRWAFEWHRSGHAVVLLRNEEPWAALSAQSPRGMSRHLVKPCRWGEPWSAAWYEKWVHERPGARIP